MNRLDQLKPSLTRPGLIEMSRSVDGNGSPQENMAAVRRGIDAKIKSGELTPVTSGRDAGFSEGKNVRLASVEHPLLSANEHPVTAKSGSMVRGQEIQVPQGPPARR